MQIVRVVDDDEFDKIPSLAIAIAGDSVSNNPERRHAGLYFRSDEDPLKIIHLGWHGKLESMLPDMQYAWIAISGIDPIILDNIADWLPQTLQANNGNLPYSIKPFDSDPFDEHGTLRFSEPGDGFTCATFVLWIFHHFNLPLIALENWENRKEDTKWREWIVDMLRRTKNSHHVSEEHIMAQIPFIEHAARFRPEEVGGAAGSYSGAPLGFSDAIDVGEKVLVKLRDLGMVSKLS